MNCLIGDKVEHEIFGVGEVVSLNMSGPVVKFDDHTDKMCCPQYKLTILSKYWEQLDQLKTENNLLIKENVLLLNFYLERMAQNVK